MCMTLIFAALAPACLMAARAAGDYATASNIAQHKIEQLRASGFANLNVGGLQGLNVIDATQPSGYPQSNPSGFPSGSTAYSFTSSDNLASAFPSGATGIITVAPDQNAPSSMAYDITVAISWTSANGNSGNSRTYTATTIIANV